MIRPRVRPPLTHTTAQSAHSRKSGASSNQRRCIRQKIRWFLTADRVTRIVGPILILKSDVASLFPHLNPSVLILYTSMFSNKKPGRFRTTTIRLAILCFYFYVECQEWPKLNSTLDGSWGLLIHSLFNWRYQVNLFHSEQENETRSANRWLRLELLGDGSRNPRLGFESIAMEKWDKKNERRRVERPHSKWRRKRARFSFSFGWRVVQRPSKSIRIVMPLFFWRKITRSVELYIFKWVIAFSGRFENHSFWSSRICSMCSLILVDYLWLKWTIFSK